MILISEMLNVSLDYLLKDTSDLLDKEEKLAVYVPSGKIAISTFDNKNVIVCQAVKSFPVFAPKKGEPKYTLNGVDKVTFLGENTTILGWYASLEDIQREIKEIIEAINKVESTYTLKYAANIVTGTFGGPKIIKQNTMIEKNI